MMNSSVSFVQGCISPEIFSDGSDDEISNDEEGDIKLRIVPVSQLLEEVVEALSLEKNEDWVKHLLESKDFTRYEQFDDYERDGKPIGNLIDLLTRKNTDTDSKYPTALHLLATGESHSSLMLENKKLSQLVGFLVRHHGNLLDVQDNGGSTPLHDAIKNKKAELVDCICRAHTAQYIDEILSRTNHKKKNCLHVAIENEVPFLMSLVERASARTLSAKDDKGNTPLHLAVEYKHCKTNQLQVIQEIIKKCDAEMQRTEELDDLSRNLTYNDAKMSPYSYHVFTASKHQEEKTKKAGEKSSSFTSIHDMEGIFEGSKHNILTASIGSLKSRSDVDFVTKPPFRSNTQNFPKGESLTARELGSTEPLSISWGHPESNIASASQGEDMPKHKSERRQSRDQRNRGPKRTKESVADIKKFLKLHYLRTRSHDVAYSIIHGRPPRVGNDLQIFFDLQAYDNTEMTSDQLERFFENEKFDDVLQRVTVPASFTIRGSRSPANSGKTRTPSTPSELSSRGRTNLESVFEWLREIMKVKTILSVSVNDLKTPAHSDESIEKALQGFGIEIWDWQKMDISVSVIETVAPNVRVVHLHWSGNNAVLRGWSEEGGLKRLQELEVVHIHTQSEYLNSYNRTKSDMNSFKMRMKKLCENNVNIITYGLDKPHRNLTSSAPTASMEPSRQSQHEWISCMNKFGSLLLDAETNFSPVNQHAILLEEPIRVALIDDGINITRLMHKHNGGQSFATRDGNVIPYYMSSGGHGPAMASQIYRICPRAQLHVLKLDDHSSKGEGRQITPWSAAQAIRDAVAKKVHIISMSWTIPLPEDDATKNLLESAISEAREAKILMFCSASDRGPVEDKSFPWRAATDKIFRIGAATADGMVDPKVGNPNSLNFTFPGSGVETDEIDKTVKYQTGSSIATALATGLAALVLYCVQISLFRATKDTDKTRIRNVFKKLKEYDGMLTAFNNIGTTQESGGKYIAVWNMFGKYIRKDQNNSAEELIDLIAELGGELSMKV